MQKKGNWNSYNNFEKKSKMGRLRLFDIKIYYQQYKTV